MSHINLVKLCVGAEAVEDLTAWQKMRAGGDPDYEPRHVTRMWPQREEELLNGGSLYWVFKSVILARQRVVRLDEVVREDGIRRCGLVLDREVVRTHAAPRRPFQGWRYLKPEDAPRDLGEGEEDATAAMPAALLGELAKLGLV